MNLPINLLDKLQNLHFPGGALRNLGARILAPLEPWLNRLRELAAPAWSSAQAWFEKREPREKVLLRALGAVFAVLIFYGAIYSPIIDLRDGVAERVVTRQENLADIRAMMLTYDRVKRDLASTESRTVAGGKDFSLFSVLEQTLTTTVGREKIASITPASRPLPGDLTEYSVDVKLSGISLAQTVDALYGMQTLPVPVTVSDLQIHQHAQDSRSYDVDITCLAVGHHA